MNLNQKCINYLRCLSADMITTANSGHPGVALGATTIMYALFKDHYFYDIKDHNFIARDRLVLSAGHASALYYATAYMFNFGLTEKDLKSFRQINSKTPGHPEYGVTNFVETSTGPLGQGVANAVGMAIGQDMVAKRFNAQKCPVIDNYTYCFVGDGCLMEGVAQEALSLAGTLKLNKLILLYDYNNVTIDGSATLANSENIAKKFKAMHFNVIKVNNANSYYCVTKAIAKAKRCTQKPSVIIFKTTIGYGTEKAGLNSIHGTPLSVAELNELKLKLNVENPYNLPDDVKNLALKTIQKNSNLIEKWNNMFAIYQTTNPELYRQLLSYMENKTIEVDKLIKNDMLLQSFSGRDANEMILKELSSKMPRFVGGTADLAPSTKAYIIGGGDYSSKNPRGKNIHFGVREHAMGAICNGLTLYLNSPTFCATFLTFSNYMIPPIRMSALMNLPVMYMFSHDSYKVGEDGPTHQSVEQLSMLRSIPNVNVFRPCDIRELICCYSIALSSKTPSCFILSKQTLQNQYADFKNIVKGGYILSGNKGKVLLLATGSEVELAMQVKKILQTQNIEAVVASFPCVEQFEKQTTKYKNDLLSRAPIKVSIEASNDNIWYKYIGKNGLKISVENFGKSAKSTDLDVYFGFTPNIVANKIKKHLKNFE